MLTDNTQSLIEHLYQYRDSQHPAVQDAALTLTYAELIGLVDHTAAQLHTAGVKPGDRVLVMLTNSTEHIVGVLAIIALGAIAVPLDAEAGNARLADVVRQTSPRLCVAGEHLDTPPTMQIFRLHIDNTVNAARDPASGAGRFAQQQHPVAFIRFTSGSTGQAKGVIIDHAQQLWTARTLSGYFGIDTEHRELVLVSMALSGGWQRVAATLYGGGCVIIGEKPLSVGDLLDMVVDTGATGFFTPPPLVRMLLSNPADKVRSALQNCRTIEIGSAAMTADELRALTALAPQAHIFFHYGLTECSRAAILDASRHPEKLATAGRPLPEVDVKIVDDEGRTLATGQNGQIFVRGPQLTRGYWQQPGLDRERFIAGWLATGDYGYIDEDGFLTLLGRHDDLINCGGHCYFPDEVEQALGTPGGIEQYLVAGVADPRGILQQVPWAFVVPGNEEEWSPGEFLALARARLPAHMMPRQVIVVPRLPLTASGKPDRRETVKLYASKGKNSNDEQNRDH
jgi:acyl-CoA synthetase (AMP-forming)/AMP-acid ligase II